MPILSNEFSHPREIIAVKDCVFRASHNQAIDFDKLAVANFFRQVAKLGEGKVSAFSINGGVRPNSDCKIRCQGHEPVDNTPILRLLYHYWKVARKKWTLFRAVEQRNL
jgi:hypothetical protein